MKEITTNYGTFIPQYEDDGARRKYKEPITYYETGAVESIALQQQTLLQTPAGKIPAEHLIFYPSGNIKRIFPLDGKITGYWTEEDEYALAAELSFSFPFGTLQGKIIGIYFYDGGGIKSLTLWPKEKAPLTLHSGEVEARIGISFYENGDIQSCEPAQPTLIKTPIGYIKAYDPTALGVNGDRNSLEFNQEGQPIALVTSLNCIEIKGEDGNVIILEPALKQNLFNPQVMDLVPLRVVFQGDQVMICHKGVAFRQTYEEFSLTGNEFIIRAYVRPTGMQCSSCENCTECG